MRKSGRRDGGGCIGFRGLGLGLRGIKGWEREGVRWKGSIEFAEGERGDQMEVPP